MASFSNISLGSGDFIVRIVADYTEQIRESNEDNNSMDHFVKIVRPDLIVKDFYLTGMFGIPDNKYKMIRAEICNMGIVDVKDEFKIRLYQNDVSGVIADESIKELAQNDCTTVAFPTYGHLDFGYSKISIEADSGKQKKIAAGNR